MRPAPRAVAAAIVAAAAGAAGGVMCSPTARAAAPDFRRAVNLVWFSPDVEPRVLDQQLDNLAAVGVTHVAANVWWFQENIHSTQVAPNYNLYSSTDQTLRQVIDAAHARGMSVQLRPLVDLSNDPSHWRGQIVGGNAWFNGAGGYGDYVRHMADIAQEKNVGMFSVGVELESVASQETNWRNLIASVRSRYSGALTYAANWGNPAIQSVINWWDAVDYLGIDAYYPLSNSDDPTPAELQAAWASRANQIEAYVNAVAPGKTVLFTEAGYMNYDGANRAPYAFDPTAPNDQREQADAYQALLSQNVPRDWFGGVYWWAWDVNNPNPAAIGFDPTGKLAYDVMASHYTPGYTLGPTWTGAGGNTWIDDANWSSGAAPGSLTTATFSGPGNGSANVTLGGPVATARLIFDGATTPAYTIAAGGSLTFNRGGGITITDQVTATQTINCDIALEGPTIFANGSRAPNQQLVINGVITAARSGMQRLSLIGDGNGQLNGAINDGDGIVGIFKGDEGTWRISAANSFSGPVDVAWGTLVVTNNAALGSGAGTTSVLRGASLVVMPGLNVAETIRLSGNGMGGQGALQRADVAPYGVATWSGNIVLSGSAEIHNRAYNDPLAPANEFVLAGNIGGGSIDGALNLRSGNSNPGFFRLTGAANDYLGKTLVSGGKVILAGGDDTLPTTTVVELDTYGRDWSVEAGVLDLNGTDQTIAGLTNAARPTQPRVINRLAGTHSTLTINNSAEQSYGGVLLDDSGTLAVAKLGPGRQTLSGANTHTGGTTVGGGTLVLAHAGAAGSGALTVTGGTAVFPPDLAAPIVLPALVAGVAGRVDLNDNELIIDYAGASPAHEIRAMIASAFAAGTWAGPGLASSLADADTIGLGFVDAVAETTLRVHLARYGDATLDGECQPPGFQPPRLALWRHGQALVRGRLQLRRCGEPERLQPAGRKLRIVRIGSGRSIAAGLGEPRGRRA